MFNPTQLHRALAAHLGSELTPEIAAAVCAQASQTPDKSIDPDQFAPQIYSGYVIRVERFKDVLPELEPLHAEHWQETEKHRHGIAMNPDYEGMAERERAGRMLQFTVRKGGELVGNLRVYLKTSMHSQTMFAEEDTLYLRLAHRGGFLAVALLRYAEDALRAIGVREIRANSKLVNKADVLMRRLGYRAVAMQFVKVFKE